MKGRAPTILAALVILALCAVLLMMYVGVQAQKSKVLNLQGTIAELEQSRQANAPTKSADDEELQRLRKEHDELLKLRGEVAQLRRQVAELSKRAAVTNLARPTAPAPTNGPVSPVENYQATLRASVAWNQSLVTGGWKVADGKRALVFVEPDGQEAGNNQVTLRTHIVEVPEAVLAQAGLDRLKTDGKQTSAQAVLAKEQADAIFEMLKSTAGVNVLSAPTVLTLDGRQAQVRVGETKTAPTGEQYQTGPLIDIVPQMSPDRSSVTLSILAQLRYPTAR